MGKCNKASPFTTSARYLDPEPLSQPPALQAGKRAPLMIPNPQASAPLQLSTADSSEPRRHPEGLLGSSLQLTDAPHRQASAHVRGQKAAGGPYNSAPRVHKKRAVQELGWSVLLAVNSPACLSLRRAPFKGLYRESHS